MVNGLNYEQVIERLFDDGFKLHDLDGSDAGDSWVCLPLE